MFVTNAHVLFIQHMCLTTYARQSCLVNNFADFPDVLVKKNQKSNSVVGGVSLQKHLPLDFNFSNRVNYKLLYILNNLTT